MKYEMVNEMVSEMVNEMVNEMNYEMVDDRMIIISPMIEEMPPLKQPATIYHVI